jgi:hypothetical protein
VHVETWIASVQTGIGRMLVPVAKAEIPGENLIQSDMVGELEGDTKVLGFKIKAAQPSDIENKRK